MFFFSFFRSSLNNFCNSCIMSLLRFIKTRISQQRMIHDKIHEDFEFLTRRLHLLGWERKTRMLPGGGSSNQYTSTMTKGWWTAQRTREYGRDLFKLKLRFPEGYCHFVVKTTDGKSLTVVSEPSTCSRSDKRLVDTFVSRVRKGHHVTISGRSV